jgi:SAM-dependent methyltransferase
VPPDSLDGVDEATVERVLAEQRRYYRERAPEYDDWWFRRDAYALDAETEARWFADVRELEAALEAFGPRGDVLELAAGTGVWTRQLLRFTDRVTAVDAVAEVLELNCARTGGAAEYVLADVFEWQPPNCRCRCSRRQRHRHVADARARLIRRAGRRRRAAPRPPPPRAPDLLSDERNPAAALPQPPSSCRSNSSRVSRCGLAPSRLRVTRSRY